MLRWYESESSSTERRAPLILIPVQLARSGVREKFKLKWTGDDIEANLSLEATLKQDFGVRLPEMPAEDVFIWDGVLLIWEYGYYSNHHLSRQHRARSGRRHLPRPRYSAAPHCR